MDRRHRFSSPFSSTRVYSRKYPRLHSCAIFIAKTLNVSSFSKYLTQSQNFLSYVYSFHTELYVQTSIRFYLKSPRLFDRNFFRISSFRSLEKLLDDVSLSIEAKGGKEGWEVKARIELASSIRHLWRENPSNRKRKDSLDGFLLSSFLRIFHFEFPAKRYVEPRRLKKRNRLESKRDSLAARASEKGRSGMEKGGKSKRRKRGRGRSERRVTGGLSILRTVVKVRRV